MGAPKHTPGPWEYVPGNEHHGPYITSDYGSTIADCYVMSRPSPFTQDVVKPVRFMAEMAEPNARLIAAAPRMHDYIAAKAQQGDAEALQIMEAINADS